MFFLGLSTNVSLYWPRESSGETTWVTGWHVKLTQLEQISTEANPAFLFLTLASPWCNAHAHTGSLCCCHRPQVHLQGQRLPAPLPVTITLGTYLRKRTFSSLLLIPKWPGLDFPPTWSSSQTGSSPPSVYKVKRWRQWLWTLEEYHSYTEGFNQKSNRNDFEVR